MENRRPARHFGAGKEIPVLGTEKVDESIRLNRYIAYCGICSRREADD
jgi:hypothetical protein